MSLHANNTHTTTPVKKPFCKVCFDAKKTEAIYTGHWVRSRPNFYGVVTVTCPTLLNNPCQYCNKIGHTNLFCRELKQDKRAERSAIYNNKTHNVPTQYIIQGKKKNAFSVLVDQETSEEEQDEEKEKPGQNTCDMNKKDRKKDRKIKKKESKKDHKKDNSQDLRELGSFFTPTPAIPVATKKVPVNWADRVDSDDDSDDEF
jgi:hypothetical protein